MKRFCAQSNHDSVTEDQAVAVQCVPIQVGMLRNVCYPQAVQYSFLNVFNGVIIRKMKLIGSWLCDL